MTEYILMEVAGRSYDRIADGEPMKIWSELERQRFLATLDHRITVRWAELPALRIFSERGKGL